MAAKAAGYESRRRRLKVDGGSGLGGFGGFLVIGGALVAAAIGAGFTARAFRKRKRPEIDEEDLKSIGNVEGGVIFKEEQKGQESFGLENQSPPSPQALEFPPPPPTPSLASSEDDNEREIGGDHVEFAAAHPPHVGITVPDMPTKEQGHTKAEPPQPRVGDLIPHMVLAPANVIVDEEGGSKTTGEEEMINESKDQQIQEEELTLESTSTDEIQEAKEAHTDEENDDKPESSGDEEENEQLSDTTEDYSMESDAYTKWPAEGTDSSYSSSKEEEEEYGMKSNFGKEPPKNRIIEQRVLGKGSQEALGKEKEEVVIVKGSKLYLHLTLSLVLLAGFLLLLDRHHERVVNIFFPKFSTLPTALPE